MALVVLFCTLLTGCAAFAPGYQAAADRKATDSFEVISVILAKAELGVLSSPESYKPTIDDYAKAISGMETVKLLIGGSTVTSAVAATAKDEEIAVIESCLENIKSLAKLHDANGLPPASGVTQPVRVTCDQAVRSVQAMK